MNQEIQATDDSGPWVKEVALAASIVVGPLVIPVSSAPKAHQVSRATAQPLRPEGLAATATTQPSKAARESNTTTAPNLAQLPKIGGISSIKPETGSSVGLDVSGAVNQSTAPETWSVSSTSYCQAGTMADGQQTYVGAVAGNMWPLGTKLRILGGEHAGEVVTLSDHIGWGSQLDFFTPFCSDAWQYGREQVTVELVR